MSLQLKTHVRWLSVIITLFFGSLVVSGQSPVTVYQWGASVLKGHGTASGALRVELPTDGTGLVSAAQSGAWNITNVSGTVSLPTGASTSALQTTGNTSLSNIDTNAGASADAIAAAGGTGTLAAKLRRVTQGLEDLKTLIVLGAGTNIFGKARLVDSGGTEVTDSTAHAAKVLQVDASGTVITVPAGNPCELSTPIQVPISQTASTKIISATSAKKNYICSLVLVAAAAEIVNVVEGTGSTCGTSTAAIVGSTTAANGMSFVANGGLSAIGGKGNAISGVGTNVDTCLTQSTSSRVAGWATYVQQ